MGEEARIALQCHGSVAVKLFASMRRFEMSRVLLLSIVGPLLKKAQKVVPVTTESINDIVALLMAIPALLSMASDEEDDTSTTATVD
jgi:hypothetical protein